MLSRSQDFTIIALARVLNTQIKIYTPEGPNRQEDLDDRYHRNQGLQRDQDQDPEVQEVQEGNSAEAGVQDDTGYLHQSCFESDPKTTGRESYRWGNPASGLSPFLLHGDGRTGRSRNPCQEES